MGFFITPGKFNRNNELSLNFLIRKCSTQLTESEKENVKKNNGKEIKKQIY